MPVERAIVNDVSQNAGTGIIQKKYGADVFYFAVWEHAVFKFFFDFRLSFSSLMARAHRRQTVFLRNFLLDLVVVMSL